MMPATINLPLHYGQCPPWLFEKMKRLSLLISDVIISEYGTKEFLTRLAHPMFFQAFGCVLAFDWHSSGLTTTVCGALKEALNGGGLGIAVCGGKGKTSRKTLEEIDRFGEELSLSDSTINQLKKASRLAARVDNNCIQDGYDLYHHAILFDDKGRWTIIQQGMNDASGYARRYHWSTTENFVDSPPDVIIGNEENDVLNTVSAKSEETRKVSVDLVRDNPQRLRKYFTGQTTLFDDEIEERKHYTMPSRHSLSECNLSEEDWKMLNAAYEYQPRNYEELIALRGIGKKKIRALALLAKLLYGTELDWKDPVKYSWAHGGKDGWPHPVDKETYESSISFLKEIIEKNDVNKKATLKNLAATSSASWRC
jgi:hypothetical protein